MIELSAFIVCDSTTQVPGPQNQPIMQINNPIHVIRPLAIPGFFSFAVVIGLTKLGGKTDLKFGLTIKAPSGEVAYKLEAPFMMPPPPQVDNLLPPGLQGLFLNIDVRNFKVTEKGYYNIEIEVDNRFLGKYDLLAYPLESKE